MDKNENRLVKLYKEEKDFRQGLYFLIGGIIIAILATGVLPIKTQLWKTIISLAGIAISFTGTDKLSKYAVMLGGEDYNKKQQNKH